MELIPIAIIVLGIISSIISGQANKKNEEKRNIDPSKLDRKSKTAPRRRQFQQEQEQSTEKKGFFENLQDNFEQEMKKFEKELDGQPQKESKTAPETPSRTQTAKRQEQPRETIQRSSSRQNTSQNVSDYEKRKTDRSRHSNRASLAKEKVLTEAYDERVTMDEGLTKEKIAERQKRRENRDKIKENDITSGDIRFDPKSVVNGIIMSEILGKPKSKQ